jgi:hypothetical protein
MAAAVDFYELRREGIGHIERTGRANWTDYNTHDPGITILEALAYAITELAYRTGFDVEDILASAAPPGAGADAPYAGQTFYSARRILTVNPTTADDLRRVLVDVDPVRNAWVRCKACECDAPLFVWCEDDELVLSHDPSTRADPDVDPVPVELRGLYDVLLELEADPTFGDLNDRKIVRRHTVQDTDGRRHVVTVEVRFPRWGLARRHERQALAAASRLTAVAVDGPFRTTTGTEPVDDAELRAHWFDVFYVDLDVSIPDGTTIRIEDVSVRLFGDGTVRRQALVADLLAWLGDATQEGFVEPYRQKLARVDDAIAIAKTVLDAHRQLDEDRCNVELVEIEDVAVCADVEVEPAADIELVQARIWYQIERYLDEPIAFWTIDELTAQGKPIEAIFNGPELENGFLTDEGLQAAALRSELRVSDLLDRLMDIEGIISIGNLQLTGYDTSGRPIPNRADPTWHGDAPEFDPERISASWLLAIEVGHRPRLHRLLSRFLFSSNGLPFLPRLDEAEDTLVQLHGAAARPKLRVADLDLEMPMGRARSMEAYHPVQHSFPLTYGIGPAGLPSTATPLRHSQAKQLKAYLLVFEQLLRNGYAQVARAGDLFSLDAGVEHTYFSALFDDSSISGYSELVAGLSADELGALVESPTEFRDRRNRFLDHLLARFGEQFGDYAMLLTDLEGQRAASDELVRDKTAYLRALPEVGHDRGKAANRAVSPCDPGNTSGLQRRINLLLGLPDLVFTYRAARSSEPAGFTHALHVEGHGFAGATFVPPPAAASALQALLTERQLDAAGAPWRIEGGDGQLGLTIGAGPDAAAEDLVGPAPVGAGGALGAAVVAAKRALLAQLVLVERYAVTRAGQRWTVGIGDAAGNAIGVADERFPSRREADDFVSRLATWSAHERAIVVEHLLLRPKFPGDAVVAACTDGACCACSHQDPYSFRITYVMPGWTAPFSTNMNIRGFADRAIQEQAPSHLLVKTCWVGNDGYIPDPCDPVVDAVAAVLQGAGLDVDAACGCAAEVVQAYGDVFDEWFAEHPLVHDRLDVLAATLASRFAQRVDLTVVACAAAIDDDVQAELLDLLVEHFVEIARHGYQFERFEDAWCRWVDADAAIDWSDERLQETVVEVLAGGVLAEGVPREVLCTLAATVLARFGTQFREWLAAQVAAGTRLDDVPPFQPGPVHLGDAPAFEDGIATALDLLLRERYAAYTEVSYRLHVLVDALDELRNAYPRATLHDCDEGSDFNPVRLGQTALGSN